MRLRLIAVLLLATCSVSAQQAPTTATLDVVVDRVTGRQPLVPADFEVVEGGRTIPVEGVKLVVPLPAAAAAGDAPATIAGLDEQQAAAAADRLVAIYVDEYHLADEAAFAASRDALAAFVRNDLGPRDLVVVLKPLDSLVSIRLSGDRQAAAQVIESATPRLGDYTARSTFEQNFIAGAPARIDAARSQIALSSMSALTTHLGRFATGRKTLIVLSNGIPPAPGPRGDRVLPGFESIARVANRDRVAIYVVRPTPTPPATRTVTAVDSTAASDPLSTLAQQTTGFVIAGTGQIANGLRRIATDASRYYLLTIDPDGATPDGRFRSVQVAVKRPNAQIRARSGYSISRPAPAGPRPNAMSATLSVPRHTSTIIRPWFGQSAGTNGATHVDFVWEPAPLVPGLPRPPATPSRVAMTVTTLEGTPIFSGQTNASEGDRLLAAGAPPQLSFDAPPGRLLVQLEIQDTSGRVLDRDVRDLVVTPFDDPLAFGTPAIFRARTMPALRAIAEGRTAAAPVAARQFSRAEQLLVRMPLASRDGGATVTASLESRFGAKLRTVPVVRSGSSVEVQLPLAGLASGGYALAFEAEGGGATTRTRVEFTVTP
jgi:VWFA-related protein